MRRSGRCKRESARRGRGWRGGRGRIGQAPRAKILTTRKGWSAGSSGSAARGRYCNGNKPFGRSSARLLSCFSDALSYVLPHGLRCGRICGPFHMPTNFVYLIILLICLWCFAKVLSESFRPEFSECLADVKSLLSTPPSVEGASSQNHVAPSGVDLGVSSLQGITSRRCASSFGLFVSFFFQGVLLTYLTCIFSRHEHGSHV